MTRYDLPSIVLVGGTGAGKSTAADLLHLLGYERFGFAGRADAPHPRSPRDVVTWIWGAEAINDRPKLIALANAARSVDPDVWLRALEQALDNDAVGVPVVVDDCRFENELWGLKGRGFTSIRITAPLTSRVDRLRVNGKWLSDDYLDSVIEHHLDKTVTDYNIHNDGTVDEMFNELITVIEKERKKR